jgi:hypothetical protein
MKIKNEFFYKIAELAQKAHIYAVWQKICRSMAQMDNPMVW